MTFQTFYDSLSTQGNWVQTDDYGYVWQPNVNDPNWAPYTDGHWVYTDDGWTWDSDESYGWAVYHYGAGSTSTAPAGPGCLAIRGRRRG